MDGVLIVALMMVVAGAWLYGRTGADLDALMEVEEEYLAGGAGDLLDDWEDITFGEPAEPSLEQQEGRNAMWL